MVCSECGGKTRVVETAINSRDNVIHRMRKCMSCKRNFYTTEAEVELNNTLRRTFNNYRNCYIRRRATRSNSNMVKVRCIDTGEVFESVSAAARSIEINRSAICLCCQGKRKTAGGMEWEYYKEDKE